MATVSSVATSDKAAGRAPQGARLSRFRYRHRYLVGYLFILPWFISFIWFDVIPF